MKMNKNAVKTAQARNKALMNVMQPQSTKPSINPAQVNVNSMSAAQGAKVAVVRPSTKAPMAKPPKMKLKVALNNKLQSKVKPAKTSIAKTNKK